MNALCQFSIHARIDFDQDSGKSGNRIASVALALGEHSLRLGAMKSVARLSPLQASPGSGLFLLSGSTVVARRSSIANEFGLGAFSVPLGTSIARTC